ncbi:GNAT family N-acetyltransferase [Massilia sp. S19_KUP03_FR1]|uniref:GNAT family N-acetyltransferase n=1 Tax=Massilia sp. S19_KUP03_FR1 TaxID=3025503 RepID=UPI002FCDDBED
MHLRRAVPADFSGMWPIFQEVVASESTYVFTADTSEAEAFAYWFGPGVTSYVAEEGGAVVAMYKLVANQVGLGGHVANASFMVAARAGGRGIGRQLGLHCLQQALEAGFLAMQFNFVVSTNAAAVKLWQSLGFTIVGTLPQVFRHRELGLVDAFVMHRFLE